MASQSLIDDLDDFLTMRVPLQQISIDGQQTNGVLRQSDDDDDFEDYAKSRASTSNLGTDYAAPYVKQELEDAQNMQGAMTMRDVTQESMNGFEDTTSIGEQSTLNDVQDEEAMNAAYVNYTTRKVNLAQPLPIESKKKQIIDTIRTNSVVILEGPTGCGKTTQVPQWILDDRYQNRLQCSIVVTQPRRIAAISIAKRVCQERGWELGQTVGYQVSLDAKLTENSKIQYMTTGVLLQKLILNKTLNNYTHVILDEVHERGQEMDFLLILVRKFLATNSRNVKVILMSATFDVKNFDNYFSIFNPLTLSVEPERNRHEVKMFYLNHLWKLLGKDIEIKRDSPGISEDGYRTAAKLIRKLDGLDITEERSGCEENVPSVLVFLPGINEIEEMYKLLTEENDAGHGSEGFILKPIALHSSVTSAEQSLVFIKAPPKHRKIILSTNIAESSITVPDVKYVIDFCLTKVLVTDRFSGFSSLQLEWAAQSSTIQRAGRAGRVRDGRVFRLVPEDFYNEMDAEPVPEMLRCPLERLVLLTKMLDVGPPKAVLGLAMNPPDLANIKNTVLKLKEIGGLLLTVRDEYDDEDGDITYVGRLMAKLPLDVHIAKLIILGYVFGCLDKCIIIGANMSVRNVFNTPFNKQLNSYTTKLTWADRSSSDSIAHLKAYMAWEAIKSRNTYSDQSARQWLQQCYVSERAFMDARTLIADIRRRLTSEGILDVNAPAESAWLDTEEFFILKAMVAGAFYPHIFKVGGSRDGVEEQMNTVWRDLCGRDPRTSVYLSGWDSRQPIALYANQIKKLFQPCLNNTDEIAVTMDNNGSKIFVTFPHYASQNNPEVRAVKNFRGVKSNETQSELQSGSVVPAVYKAVKMRLLQHPMKINVMPHHKSQDVARKAGLVPRTVSSFFEPDVPIATIKMEERDLIRPAKIPDVDDNYIDLVVTSMINCGRFYAQYADDTSQRALNAIQMRLNTRSHLQPIEMPLFVGLCCAAPYREADGTTGYYRARIESILAHHNVKIQYVDYGDCGVVEKKLLRRLPPLDTPHDDDYEEYEMSSQEVARNYPALAILCSLAQIGPSIHKDITLEWSREANNTFNEKLMKRKIMGQVYSVSYGVVALTAIIKDPQYKDMNFNDYLISKGLAQKSEETYASKLNRNLRDDAVLRHPNEKIAMNKEQERVNQLTVTQQCPKFSQNELTNTVYLKGPFSPLETNVRGIINSTLGSKIKVEGNSVNSVILNNSPPDSFDRYLVASAVSRSGERSLILRNATLLPQLAGVGELLAMIFCPQMRLRSSPAKDCYAGAVFGLGADDNGRPLHPDHDIHIPFDVVIDNEDIQNINNMRYLMNKMLVTADGCDEPSVPDSLKTTAIRNLKQLLIRLLFKKRALQPPYTLKKTLSWQRTPHHRTTQPDGYESDIEVEPNSTDHDEGAIYPLHNGLILGKNLVYTEKQSLMNSKLHLFADSIRLSNSVTNSSTATMTCELCSTAALNRHDMRIHLQSFPHKDMEARLPAVFQDDY